MQVLRDIPYVSNGSEAQKLNVCLPDTVVGALPAIIWVHGGGWGKGNRHDLRSARFLSSGYAAISIGYRLSSEATWPAQIEDCKAAVRYLRANAATYHLDPDHFGAWGESAGGHLAAFLGTSGNTKTSYDVGDNLHVSSGVQAVCDWFGPTDVLRMDAQAPADSKIVHDSAGSPESRLIGGAIQDHKDRADSVNPIRHITPDAPPFLIVHGDHDNLVPIGQSEILTDALRGAGVEVTFLRLAGAGHGGAAFRVAEVDHAMAQFFAKHLKRTPVDQRGLRGPGSPFDSIANRMQNAFEVTLQQQSHA